MALTGAARTEPVTVFLINSSGTNNSSKCQCFYDESFTYDIALNLHNNPIVKELILNSTDEETEVESSPPWSVTEPRSKDRPTEGSQLCPL